MLVNEEGQGGESLGRSHHIRLIAGCGLLLAVVLCAACDLGQRGPLLDLPPRPENALTGTEVVRDIRSLDLEAREERIFREISHGNVPTWLRRLRPVVVRGDGGGREPQVTFWVTPDYLAVGSDADYFLVPLSPQTAQRIADLVGASLPTPSMVDAIWASAQVRLAPIRIGPNEDMTTMRYFERHDRLVQAQRRLLDVAPGAFVAGHKLDIVLSATLPANPGRVLRYGWHQPDGQPIQRLSSSRQDDWVAFSHGIRLVDRTILVNEVPRDLFDVLADPQLVSLLSREGVIPQVRYPTMGGKW